MCFGAIFLLRRKGFTREPVYITSQQETGHKLFYMTVSISIFRGECCSGITYRNTGYTKAGAKKKKQKKPSLVKFSYIICPACNEWLARFYGFPNREPSV